MPPTKPKQKTPKGASASMSSSSITINDPRFSNFSTDPRFKLPSKNRTRTKIDKRFERMLKDDEFSNTASVDRYGRKLSSGGKKKALERLYIGEDKDSAEESDGSDEEKEDEGGVDVEDDEVIEMELKKVEEKAYDPARGGGFSSSDDESDDGEAEEEIEEEPAFPDMAAESAAAAVEMGDVSSRLAVVNLDWDNIRAVDLYAVFQSFVRSGGKIHNIAVYPSEFGKERMEREEVEGPPREIFSSNQEDDEEEEDSEEEDEKIKKELLKEDDGKEFDSAALRQYQLERLRYYYAVITTSSPSVAETIYTACDGTEYLSSSNFFDLRFVPDDVTFDDKPRDECSAVPANYKPSEFVTDALQHSKVKLTWDQDPEEKDRKDAIKRAFGGSRKDIGENDLRAYLGSDSESEAEASEPEDKDAEPEPTTDEIPKKHSKKELARLKLRTALGLASEPTPSTSSKTGKSSAPVGDIEITFTGGLTSSNDKANGKGVFLNSPREATETTAEAYIRKEKERKARRKEKARLVRGGIDPSSLNADVKDGDSNKGDEVEDDLGFNDPFFATDENIKTKSQKEAKKAARKAKREAKDQEMKEKEGNKRELELLMMGDNDVDASGTKHLDHFDFNEIVRAEKKSSKKHAKSRKGKGGEEGGGDAEGKRGGLQKSFEIDTEDPRFAGKLFGSHEFAIDPSNPKFKGTEGMKRLLEEGRKRRKGGGEDEGEGEERREKKRKSRGTEDGRREKGELSGLVESVKKKVRK